MAVILVSDETGFLRGTHPALVGKILLPPKVRAGFAPDRKISVFNDPDAVLVGSGFRSFAGVPIAPLCVDGFGTTFFFDRLHILPFSDSIIEFGNLINPVQESFEVFSAFLRQPVFLTGIDKTNEASNITVISGTEAFPFNLDPLRGEVYTVQGERNGSPTINSVWTWSAVYGSPEIAVDPVTVTYTGQRISMWSYVPEGGFSEEWRWLTDILKAFDGTERRLALRDVPRVAYRHVYRRANTALEVAGMRNQLFDQMGRVIALPLWNERETLFSDVSIGALTVNVNTTNRDFQPGEVLILWQGWNTFEAQEIESVGSGTVTVSSPFTQGWSAADTVVLPSVLAYLAESPRETIFRGGGLVEFALEFDRINRVAHLADPELASDYLSMPVFNRPWIINGTSTPVRWTRGIEDLGLALGNVRYDAHWNVPDQALAMLIIEIEGNADYQEQRKFFHGLHGRQKTFWLPNGNPDFILAETAAGGSAVIRVEQNLYARHVNGDNPRNHIQVTLTNGAISRHRITGASDVDSETKIELALSPVTPSEFTVANVSKIELLRRVRLSNDVVRVTHQPIRDESRIEIGLVEVPQ